MRSLIRPLAFAAALAAASFAIPASAVLINFDGVPSGSPATSAVPPGSGITFVEAELTPDLDVFGDPIPGTDKWKPMETGALPILASNPALVNYGSAPSPLNALDARNQQVLMLFSNPQDLASFSIKLDNSTFGTLGPVDLLFLNSAAQPIGSITLQQSIAGGSYSFGPLAGVASIYLPAGAFYDDISAVPVPEPAAWISLLVGISGLGVLTARRRGAQASPV
jgi:hypothetical protein